MNRPQSGTHNQLTPSVQRRRRRSNSHEQDQITPEMLHNMVELGTFYESEKNKPVNWNKVERELLQLQQQDRELVNKAQWFEDLVRSVQSPTPPQL